MQATGPAAITECSRVEAVIETLAAMHRHDDTLAEVAHDARNMVTALALYCDLLDEPGVLATPYRHYASELRLVAEASRRLVEKLSGLDAGEEPGAGALAARFDRQALLFPDSGPPEAADGLPIEDLREELLASRDLLAAIAGPSVSVTAEADGGAWPVTMTGENLIRLLVNLVRNAVESMAGAGTISMTLNNRCDPSGAVSAVALSVEDSGPGIPGELLDRVFEPGFTTRGEPSGNHRGLGLSIVRSIVEDAGGRIAAGNREQGGARFRIELPVGRQGTRDRGNKNQGLRD